MRLIKLIAIGLLAWPAVEIVAFVCVAAAVGFANAVFLLLLMSFAGLFVLRHFSGDVTRFRTAGAAGIAAAPLNRPGMAPGLGGILLLIPGFVTSVLGLVMLFPVSRRWLLAGCRPAGEPIRTSLILRQTSGDHCLARDCRQRAAPSKNDAPHGCAPLFALRRTWGGAKRAPPKHWKVLGHACSDFLMKLMIAASLFGFGACDSHTRERFSRVAVVRGETS